MNEELVNLIKSSLSFDLLKRSGRYKRDKLKKELVTNGVIKDTELFDHCYTAHESYYYLSGDKDKLKPYCVDIYGYNHWYLKFNNNEIIDITKEQHNDIPYNKSKIKSFVTSKPSQRCWKLMLSAFNNVKKINYTGPLFFTGSLYWFKDGLPHKEDGPAQIFINVITKQITQQNWYFNGIRMTPMEVFDQLPDEKKERVLWNLNQWK